jgi:hypothetical protein
MSLHSIERYFNENAARLEEAEVVFETAKMFHVTDADTNICPFRDFVRFTRS